MISPFNAAVVCADGSGGSITSVVVRQLGLQVKKLVVRENGFPFIDHLVPLSWLLNSSSRQVELRCTCDELSALESSGESEVSLDAAPWCRYATWEYGVWPCPPVAFLNQQTRSHLDAGDVMLSERTRLKAIDGDVGPVCEIVVDPNTYRIVQIIVQEGHFWHQKHVTIPTSAIVGVTEETITVSLKRHSIDALPVDGSAPFSPLHLYAVQETGRPEEAKHVSK